jgi:hypothetical protein
VNQASLWNVVQSAKRSSDGSGIKTNRRSLEYYRVAENLLLLGAYVNKWVNWLELESDHKPL